MVEIAADLSPLFSIVKSRILILSNNCTNRSLARQWVFFCLIPLKEVKFLQRASINFLEKYAYTYGVQVECRLFMIRKQVKANWLNVLWN
jgi:hypothetical protein